MRPKSLCNKTPIYPWSQVWGSGRHDSEISNGAIRLCLPVQEVSIPSVSVSATAWQSTRVRDRHSEMLDCSWSQKSSLDTDNFTCVHDQSWGWTKIFCPLKRWKMQEHRPPSCPDMIEKNKIRKSPIEWYCIILKFDPPQKQCLIDTNVLSKIYFELTNKLLSNLQFPEGTTG